MLFKGEGACACVCMWGGGGGVLLEIFGQTLKNAELSLISGIKKKTPQLSSVQSLAIFLLMWLMVGMLLAPDTTTQ